MGRRLGVGDGGLGSPLTEVAVIEVLIRDVAVVDAAIEHDAHVSRERDQPRGEMGR